MKSTPVRSIYRPEGMALTRRGQCATALVSVALAALAVGLGLAKRSWPIGAGLGGASLLVAGLGCSHARRSVAVDPSVLVINGTHISVVQGLISEQRNVKAIIFAASDGLQCDAIRAAAGADPFDAYALLPVRDPDQGGMLGTGSGNLERHGILQLVHMVGPLAGNDQRLQKVYVDALGCAHLWGGRRIAMSLAVREDGHALADNARIALAAIREYVAGNQVTQICIVAQNSEQMQAITAAIEAQRNQVGQA
jgi:hypothetical protein